MPSGRRQQGEGSVYRRGRNDQWVAVVDLGPKGGKRDRREFTGATPEEALEKRREFLHKQRDGFTLPKGRPPSAAEWFRHWLNNIARPRVAPTTWHKSYRQKVEELIIPFFDGPLAKIDEDDVRAWHAHLRGTVSARTGRPLSASTIGQAHRILAAALNDAMQPPKKIGHNPAAGRSMAPASGDREEPMPPDADEVRAILLECGDRRTGPRWVTAMGTGLRQGETLGMLWPHLDLADLDAAAVDVQWELVRLPWEHGCGDPHACGAKRHRRACPVPCPKKRASGRPHACVLAGDPRLCEPGCDGHAASCPERKDGGLRLKRPKSERSRAAVPLPRPAAAALRQWRSDQKAERLAHPAWTGWVHSCGRRMKPRQYVCPDCAMPAAPDLLVWTQPGGMPVDSRRDWQDWSELLEAAGLEHYALHTGTRHGTATMLLEEGVDIRVVQEIMRHSSPDFTRRTYQHVRRQLRREGSDALSRRLGG